MDATLAEFKNSFPNNALKFEQNRRGQLTGVGQMLRGAGNKL